MLAVLAPSKNMDFQSKRLQEGRHVLPLFQEHTDILVRYFASLDKESIRELMKISPAIAEQTHTWFTEFSSGEKKDRVQSAIFSYTGGTYKGLCADAYTQGDLTFAEDHLRILSGLYGLVSPLTSIEPYRLEMGLKLSSIYTGRLSGYWKKVVTEELNHSFSQRKNKTLLNLASAEYMAAIDKKHLNATVLNVVFKQERDKKLKTIGTLAKKARGMMASFLVKERIREPETLKQFDEDGYVFQPGLSDRETYVFVSLLKH